MEVVFWKRVTYLIGGAHSLRIPTSCSFEEPVTFIVKQLRSSTMSHLTIRLKSPTDPAPSSFAKYLIKPDETTIHQDPSSTPSTKIAKTHPKMARNQPKPAVVIRAVKRKLDELTESFANTTVSEAEVKTREEQDAKRVKGQNGAAGRDHANKRNEEIRASRNVRIEVMGVDIDGHSDAAFSQKAKYDPLLELRDLRDKYGFKTEYKIEFVSWKDGHMMEAVLMIKDGGFAFNGCPVFKKTIFGGKKRRTQHRMNVAKRDVARQALVWYRVSACSKEPVRVPLMIHRRTHLKAGHRRVALTRSCARISSWRSNQLGAIHRQAYSTSTIGKNNLMQSYSKYCSLSLIYMRLLIIDSSSMKKKGCLFNSSALSPTNRRKRLQRESRQKPRNPRLRKRLQR
jgi:hypothetical protein